MASVLKQVLALAVTENCCWEKILGGASYCKTYRVKLSPRKIYTNDVSFLDSGGYAVLKVIDIKLVSQLTDHDIDTVWKRFLADFSIIKGITHPNILSPIAFTTNYERNALHVKFPLALKNLVFFVRSEKRLILQATKFGRFDFLVRKYIYQIAKGLQQLHKNRMTHGHLSLENILVVNDDEDVGLSDMYFKRNFEMQKLKDCIYLPQETFHPRGVFKFASDMYALGLIVLELLLGDRISDITKGPICFQADKMKKLLRRVKVDFPKHFLVLIENLITDKSNERWTASNVVNHLEEGVLNDSDKFSGGFGDIKTKAEIQAEAKNSQ